MHKIVIDPVTGKAHTEDGPNELEVKSNLEKQRRELKDMIAGNTPFHDDPNTIVTEEKAVKEEWYRTDGWGYFMEENT